jgi:hypothetical protein
MTIKPMIPMIFVLAVLSGCATIPAGPSVHVMPSPTKPFEAFQADDAMCRQWAEQQIGGVWPSDAFNESTAGGAVLGAVVGGGLGLAVGAATGNPAAGAAIGGATGLLSGMSMGADVGSASAYALQNRYDIAYGQCMSSKGHRVPNYTQRANVYAPPPRPAYYYPRAYYYPAPYYYYPRAYYYYSGPRYYSGPHRW